MKFRFPFLLFSILFALPSFAQTSRTDLLLVASDHLAQLYRRDNPNTDVFLPKRQQEVKAFVARMVRYRPDLIMVEVLPEQQPQIDSLYALFLQDRLNLETLPEGRSEVYQMAFRIGKQLGLSRIHCVNAPGGTSQSILDNGENIELYKAEGAALRTLVQEQYRLIGHDSLSLTDYLLFLNRPETIRKIYHLRYITPARVINGTFKNPDAMVDTAFVNPRYIGVELTSVYKNRDYKIYSNIVTVQRKTGAKRALLIIGGAHIGSLTGILRDDEAFTLIAARKYLKK